MCSCKAMIHISFTTSDGTIFIWKWKEINREGEGREGKDAFIVSSRRTHKTVDRQVQSLNVISMAGSVNHSIKYQRVKRLCSFPDKLCAILMVYCVKNQSKSHSYEVLPCRAMNSSKTTCKKLSLDMLTNLLSIALLSLSRPAGFWARLWKGEPPGVWQKEVRSTWVNIAFFV